MSFVLMQFHSKPKISLKYQYIVKQTGYKNKENNQQEIYCLDLPPNFQN